MNFEAPEMEVYLDRAKSLGVELVQGSVSLKKNSVSFTCKEHGQTRQMIHVFMGLKGGCPECRKRKKQSSREDGGLQEVGLPDWVSRCI
ncbi:MAG: hypothetical protein A2426_11320 [Candidatus Lambdaproteobacteria bacterium RIFOXYC1_FULL_56_13]|nr:MAG: hypothetical protein A2426_11320 [Candidatus Lambdaproteobacteria bacterium RIFOXYC1_FULL_56_13]